MRRAALFFAVFAFSIAAPALAGGGVDLTGYAAAGELSARVVAGGRVQEGSHGASLQFGPTSLCFSGLDGDEFSFSVFGAGANAAAHGVWNPERGRARLPLDPLAFAPTAGDAYLAQCEETAPAESCAAALAGLEPRVLRSQLEIRARAHAGARTARLRGRFELALVDPLRDEAAFVWSLAFREAAPLTLYRPYSFGFCGTYFSLGASLTLVSPGSR
jgi:hypothetical protein